MCNMIPLQPIADANFVSSNVTEDDYPEWASGTTYANGDRVISVASHSVFESTADSNTGNDPDVAANVVPDTGKWVRVGSTNRWRAFDRSIGQSVSRSGSIKYTLECTTMITAIGLKGIRASSVRLRIVNPDAAETNLLDDSETSTGFTASNCTLTDGAGDGRSGLGTMVKLAENTATSSHRADAPAVALSGDVVISLDLRANGRTQAVIEVLDAASSIVSTSVFDLSDRTVTSSTGATSSIALVEGEDTYRVTIALAGLATENHTVRLYPQVSGSASYTGDGISGFFFGRMQIEAGTAETEYQHKAGGAVVGTELQNDLKQMVDTSGIQDWFDLVTFVPEFVPDYVFENAVGYVGYHVIVELDGEGGTTELAEMGWGRRLKIGDTLADSAPGFRDKSTRTEDDFGNLTVVPRETYDTMLFRISRLVGTEENTRRILAQQGKRLSFFYADKELFDRSPLILGYRPDFDGPLAAAGRSFATLEIRGLV